MLLGTLIAAAVGWALVRIYGNRNRRLLVAVPACTILIAVVIGAGLVWRVNSTLNADALSHPSYYARGAELIQLLDAAEKAGQAKDSYASKVEGALSGFAALLSNPNAGSITGDRHALLVSDLHNNTLALSSLNYYAQQQPVFFDGDFGNTGDRSEIKTLVPEIAKLGKQVIAVSGNHDSHAMMLALARSGVTVLTSRGQLLPTGSTDPPRSSSTACESRGSTTPWSTTARPLTTHAASSRSHSSPTPTRRPRTPTAIWSDGSMRSPSVPTSSWSTRTGWPSISRALSSPPATTIR